MIALQQTLPALSFADRIEQEFLSDSGIHPDLYAITVRFVADLEDGMGGDWRAPIHDALNWHYSRFGQRSQTAMEAALLCNADGSTWQAKLSRPRQDTAKGKAVKYETPRGNGAKALLNPMPLSVWRRMAERHGIPIEAPWERLIDQGNWTIDADLFAYIATLPDQTLVPDFWDYVAETPALPIIWTEGGKKALCLQSNGFVAIALYGVNGGYRKQLDGTRVLIADVLRFAQSQRPHALAFDQDTEAKTRRQVSIALHRFGHLLANTQGNVTILEWDGRLGKGVDDLIVAHGIAAFEQAQSESLSLTHWQIAERLTRQLTLPAALRLTTVDLSQASIESLPETGIVAIASPKGTGKTKLIHLLVQGADSVLSATHRIALGRNLSARLGLDWRGDIDKVQGRFITRAGYTLRVGFCVDSLLAIDPAMFEGCDLILDEAVQVVRHLLTSSTCAKDGKRPALLARFRSLLQVARRVIVADADLDNATLHYFQSLRGSNELVFLIRNDIQTSGYTCTFLHSQGRTAITDRLLASVTDLPKGKAIFVATDSKATSKTLALLLTQRFPEKRILVINSDSSGGDCERAFMEHPDQALDNGEYDVIICSPSLATGISIEATGVIAQVFGVFLGVSATDADMAQALSRVREPVDRIVWCAQSGSNFARVSRSPSVSEVKAHLKSATSATVSLVRAGLREDIIATHTGYDWDNDPHLHLFCHISATQNYSMLHLRDALEMRLRAEGHRLIRLEAAPNPETQTLLRTYQEEHTRMEAESIVAAPDWDAVQVAFALQQESLKPEDQRALTKYHLKTFYCLDTLTVEDVLWDQGGRRRAEILSLEAQLDPRLAKARTVQGMELQATWNQGYCPWDFNQIELRRALRDRLGLTEFIQWAMSGGQWTKHDLVLIAEQSRELAPQIKVALHLGISDRLYDVQVVHLLLSQLGLKVSQACWSRSVPGHEKEKLRVYQLDPEHWQRLEPVLAARQQQRAGSESLHASSNNTGSPDSIENNIQLGDPEISHLFLDLSTLVLDIWAGIKALITQEEKKNYWQPFPLWFLPWKGIDLGCLLE